MHFEHKYIYIYICPVAKWTYLDDNGVQQGPFSTEEICSWYAAGYLNGERKIKKENSEGDFVALSTIPELAPAPAAAPVQQAYQPVPTVGKPESEPDPAALEGKLMGDVKNWNEEKGFGFIIPSNGGDDVFARKSHACKGVTFANPDLT